MSGWDEGKLPPVGGVYFIGPDDPAAPVKIGYGQDIDARLRNLQTSHWIELHILAHIRGATRHDEKQYHLRYRDYSIRGEWFHRVPEITAEIDRLNDEWRRARGYAVESDA